MAKIELDYMEYSSDANAQAAYVTDATLAYSADQCSGGTVTVSGESSGYEGTKAFDNDVDTFWRVASSTPWICYQFGSGIIVRRYTIRARNQNPPDTTPKSWQFQGSNNGTDWTTLDTQTDITSWSQSEVKTYSFANPNSYTYYRLNITAVNNPGACEIAEIEMMTASENLQSYSEASIKQQGSYSLKGVGAITDSLNKTLTRTIGSPIDLSNVNLIRLDIRSTRTGSNIKIGIHDSGGTTTELTPNISSANAWEAQTWDISGVSNANKDAIDKIIITIVNADAETTFYVDNIFGVPVPVVSTVTPDPINYTDFTAKGNITDLSGETASVRGFKYGLTEADTWSASDSGSFGEGAYSKSITGLTSPKTYHVRAFVTSPAGTGYGSYVEVTTLDKSISASGYSVELRDKNGNLKRYLHHFITKISWEWNRIGGCGRCSITINRSYRGISFDALDDIQIRIKNGATSKLVYRGYIANITPTLKTNQDIVLDVRGYFDLFKKIVVHNSGDTKTYTNKTVAYIVDDIADNFIVPNSPITLGTIDTGGGSAFTADSIDFLGTVEDALRTLAELAGDVEYGVDEDLVFFWRTESSTIVKRFFIGNDVTTMERRVNWDELVNKVYLVGGDVAGVKYKKTGENTDSQAMYYLSEQIINNSSITTDGVANQYITALLAEKANPTLTIRLSAKNTALRLEDNIPMGMVTVYDAVYDRDSPDDLIGDIIGEAADGGSDITIGLTGDGGDNVTIGSGYGAQVDRISYAPSNTDGRMNIELLLGDTILETAAKIKRLELAMASITQY